MGLSLSAPSLSQQLGFAPSTNGGYSGAPISFPVVPANTPANVQTPAPSVTTPVNADPKKRFSPEQESILKLLADGFLPVTVASTLGISESAISQHLANEEFRRELAARKQITLKKYKELDDGYDRIESRLVAQLETSLAANKLFMRPGEITSILEKINKMKRRIGASDNAAAGQQVSQIVNISMPTVIARTLQITQQGRVVAVDGESILTIQSHALNGLANSAQEVIQNEQKPAQIPAQPR